MNQFVGAGCGRLPMLYKLFKQGISPMLKYYIKATEALKALRTDKKGVVSFEYIIVAACIVAVVIAVFQTDTSIKAALQAGITKISSHMAALN
jgi:Flp pilus assembly pilin Flp